MMNALLPETLKQNAFQDNAWIGENLQHAEYFEAQGMKLAAACCFEIAGICENDRNESAKEYQNITGVALKFV